VRLPSAARRAASAVGRAMRSIGYAASDLAFLAARFPRAVGRGARGFWLRLSPSTRRRLAGVALGAAAGVLLLAFLVPRLPCQFPGGDVCAPPDDAEEIVPADALGYVHATLDPESPQYEGAAETFDVLPRLARQVAGRALAQVPGPGGGPANFEEDIAPWLGDEAAVAIVPVGGGAEQVQLLEEGDAEKAAEFAGSLAAGAPRVEDYRGVDVATDTRGLATASVEGFLAIGTEEGVRRVVDVATGAEDVRPLAEEPTAAELRDELPPERFFEAYLSPDGIETLIADPASPLASLEPFVDAAASDGVAASVGAGDGAVEVAIRSTLDPERAKSNPGFFAAFPPFEPGLPQRLARKTLAYVGIAEPGTTVRELLAQATAEAPALAAGLAAAAERLRDVGDVELQEELLPSLGGEAAFALQPGSKATEATPPPEGTTTAPAPIPEGLPEDTPQPPGEPVPTLQFLAEGVDSERARRTLAQLQGPIAEALDPGTTLQAPVFDRREVEGIDMQVLRISPTVNLSYAVAGEDLAIATQPEGVEQVVTGDGGLDDSELYQTAMEDLAEEPSLLAFLDLAGLLALAEREGLAEDPAYALFAGELQRLRAAGLSVAAAPSSVSTDLRVVVAQDAEEVEEADPPVAPSAD
jgi:hypothetical protein